MSEQAVRVQLEHLSVNSEEVQSLFDDLSRPPTMNDDELRAVFERGRIVSRLRAARKLSSLVMAYAADTVTESFITSTYLNQVVSNVDAIESELLQYDAISTADNVSTGGRVDGKTDRIAKAPSIQQVSGDFLKRRQTAVCSQTDPEIFFPEKGGSTKQAKKICNLSCDLLDECLDWALKNNEKFGIWGGLSERERRKHKKMATA